MVDPTVSLPSLQELVDRYGLTELQARFVQELAAAGFNASEAARRAGYSESTAGAIGHENLKKPKIQAAVAAVTGPLTEAAEVEATRVLEEFRRVAFSNILDYVTWDAEGRVTMKPSAELARAEGAAVKKIKSRTRHYGDHSETTVEIEFHGKTKAMEKLGQYLGLWTDPTEVQGWILQVFNELSPEELAQIEEMGDEELMELIEDRGIYRLPEAFR